MRRAFEWAMVVASVSGCGMFKEHKDPCLDDPLGCLGDASAPGDPQVGSACTTDDACSGTLRLSCVHGKCAFSGDLEQGDPCTVTAECGQGLFCSTDDGSFTCKKAGKAAQNERCDSTADCAPSLVCEYDAGFTKHCIATGKAGLGDSCSLLSDCLAGLLCQPAASGDGKLCGKPTPQALQSLTVWSGVECPPDSEKSVAYFRVPRGDSKDGDFFRLPFPNDVRRLDDGLDLTNFPSPGDRLGTGVDFVGAYVKAASQDLRGFATNPVVYFRFSKPYQGASRENVALVDITPDSPQFGQAMSRAWRVSSGRVTRYVCENWLSVQSKLGEPLLPGHTYAVLLTSGITAGDGKAFERDADLKVLLANASPSDSKLTRAHQAYAPLRAYLATSRAKTLLGGKSVLNAAVFTTQDTESVLAGLRTVARAAATPKVKDVTVCDTGVTSPCNDGMERVCDAAQSSYAEIHGRIALPIFQRGTAPYESTGGDIELDAKGLPVVQRTEEVCFGLTLPKTEMPANGYPLVIYAHGTGGSFKSGIHDLGAFAASASAAVLTFDLPQHGSRKNGSTRGSDELFYNFANPRAARDNVAQGSADIFSLVYWGQSASATADSAFKQAFRFDPTRIALFGHSQGATHTSLVLPREDGVMGAVLSGIGGDLGEALVRKKSPIDIASALPMVLGDPESAVEDACKNCVGARHPVLELMQAYFERVDPVNFGRELRQPPVGVSGKNVFMTFGIGDTYAPDVTQSAYALAADFDQVNPTITRVSASAAVNAPLLGNVQIGDHNFTQGVRQYQPKAGEDGHFVYLGPAKADWERFLKALLGGEQPAVGQ